MCSVQQEAEGPEQKLDSGHLVGETRLEGDEGEGSVEVPHQLGAERLDHQEGGGGLSHHQVRRHHGQRLSLAVNCHSTRVADGHRGA